MKELQKKHLEVFGVELTLNLDAYHKLSNAKKKIKKQFGDAMEAKDVLNTNFADFKKDGLLSLGKQLGIDTGVGKTVAQLIVELDFGIKQLHKTIKVVIGQEVIDIDTSLPVNENFSKKIEKEISSIFKASGVDTKSEEQNVCVYIDQGKMTSKYIKSSKKGKCKIGTLRPLALSVKGNNIFNLK